MDVHRMDDDLLSIAFSNNSSSSSSSLDSRSSWNPHHHHHFHNLGVFNSLLHSSPCMEDYLVSPLPSDQCHPDTCLQSTGYLEDVLSEFCSKRRRLQLTFSDQCHNTASQFDHTSIQYLQNYWMPSNDVILEGSITVTDVKTPEEEEEEGISETNTFTHDEYSASPSSSQKENAPPQKGNLLCVVDPIFSSEGKEGRKKRALSSGKVAYPFAMVKPGGYEGDITLKDINKRILMPPTRAVRHPVGDYACRPMITPEGPGLSGKAVVAFTRIHTQGRGTITIIRTRG